MKYIMEISPALLPEERHLIECKLEQLGYHVIGGGTDTDMSSCDISFSSDYEACRRLEKIKSKEVKTPIREYTSGNRDDTPGLG